MFHVFLERDCFYFSHTFDLTNPLNKLAQFGSLSFKIASCDRRFFYNEAHVQRLISEGLQEWVTPFICGLVEFKLMKVNGKSVNLGLISRRDKSRAGMRFISRGGDMEGNVTNFAENEQIFIIHLDSSWKIFSFLQTRGSIPIPWQQTPNMKWTPKLKIEANSTKVKNCFNAHMSKIRKSYGKNTLVNLIDKKGSQNMIGKVFTDLFLSEHDDGTQHYVWFDFHHECRNMQYHNLSKLLMSLSKNMDDYKYTQMIVKKDSDDHQTIEAQSIQNGVIRTNCMDCLDRTNVAQSVFARNILLNQLFAVRNCYF